MNKLLQLNKSYKILVSGGGTGGHIFPAIAIANEIRLRYPESQFLFVGAKHKMEMEKVPAAGYPIEGLWISGFQRSFNMSNLAFPFKLLHSYFKAGSIVRKFKPHIAIGTGGYASGPALNAAMRNGIPGIVQEQNSYPGVTNRILARKAEKVFVAYANMEHFFPSGKTVMSGNPVRREIIDNTVTQEEGKKHFKIPNHKKVVLIVGGSLGARTFNECMLRDLNRIRQEEIHVIWQTGKLMADQCRKQASGMDNVTVTEFIPDMAKAYAAADVIVSRAGAIAISELCVVGKPVILVPFPYAAEDHQTSNARSLENAGAAIHISDANAATQLINTMLQLTRDQEKQEQLSKSIRKLAVTDAAVRIVDEIEKILKIKEDE
ncbi:MAG: UDP-diphospho-muramoylpentapeptide beta-N-acetylglucosaminyltransferase [Sphingobacteriales bacterium BACL12 MAG-120813-bin55]|jgi:UDP-N-acetylglucosamine--N-acetylmuramyl-(pentapeptide) pyrophosphoryl-undecaprenol N-acetylglucosamine transferase|nr:MAG: UDP-diphospho-muramoylpentapeptide beta-N-acetylglucosaminyltransferase [Sphingobacteriales bacterium BACL12 MAG-120802-bin5]KRP09293.1 MAG: UDP-diphospho-muramoylpentapeptide beta-N-acetylglucosaminyltransferase [Sphingobacteriales bacterium BACL12 MAG-120813-bin55]